LFAEGFQQSCTVDSFTVYVVNSPPLLIRLISTPPVFN